MLEILELQVWPLVKGWLPPWWSTTLQPPQQRSCRTWSTTRSSCAQPPPRMLSRFCQRWELKILQTWGSARRCQHTGKILKGKVPRECQVQKEMALKTLSFTRYGRQEHEKWLLEYSLASHWDDSGYSGYSASTGQEKQCRELSSSTSACRMYEMKLMKMQRSVKNRQRDDFPKQKAKSSHVMTFLSDRKTQKTDI